MSESSDATGESPKASDEAVEQVAKAIRDCSGLLLVVTGAGVSLASGIPTFRGTDPGAVWQNEVMEKGTYRYFRSEPVDSWRWYAGRFEGVRDAEPNPAHRALVELERLRAEENEEFLVITQNVDGLHRLAGAERLVEVHGSSRYVRCASDGCALGAPNGRMPREEAEPVIREFLAAPNESTLPRCPRCGDTLRPHVLWFDEFYADHVDYQWPRVQDAALSAEVVLFVGTSFSVGVTDLVAQHAGARGARALSIDPGAARPPYRSVEAVRAAAEDLLPRVVERLRSSD